LKRKSPKKIRKKPIKLNKSVKHKKTAIKDILKHEELQMAMKFRENNKEFSLGDLMQFGEQIASIETPKPKPKKPSDSHKKRRKHKPHHHHKKKAPKTSIVFDPKSNAKNQQDLHAVRRSSRPKRNRKNHELFNSFLENSLGGGGKKQSKKKGIS